MEVIRTIHPVGQGGFYTESFNDYDGNDFMVAYDCGGNDKQFMEDYLKKFIHEGPKGTKMKIDAIFISHLHSDHINGLKYLLDNTFVKYLFLPQLTNDMLIEVLFNNTQHANNIIDNQELTNFILNIYGDNTFYGETRIIRVLPATDNGRINIERDDNVFDLSSNFNDSSIQSGTIIKFGKSIHQWQFIPYNPHVLDSDGDFSSFLKSELRITTINPRMMPDIITNYSIDYIQRIYKDYFGSNHNSYSMTLFSGTKHRCHDCFECYKCHKYRFCKKEHRLSSILFHQGCYPCCHNCLYTGDFETKYIDMMRNFYKPLWDTISLIQVPHHGSRNNFHSNLYDYACIGFVSAGTKNKYHHPNIDTLIDISSQGCHPIVVTDNLSTMFVSKYSF